MVFYLMAALDDAIGYRDVNITTEPPGARLAFAPLNPATGEPLDDHVIFAQGVTPLSIRLPADDYFVVAVLGDVDSPAMRFHEVFRHVPKKDQVGGWGDFPSQSWMKADDGSVTLPTIILPEASIDRAMAKFSQLPDGLREFRLDPYEFTVADYRALREGDAPSFIANIPPDGYALYVNYDRAAKYAEESGKRLPFDGELVHAIQLPTTNGVATPASHDPSSFCPVMSTDREFDRTDGQQGSVWGLHSNVAEWTASRMRVAASSVQIVRGGDGDVINGMNKLPRDRAMMTFAIPLEIKPGLGFRLARSAKPRYFFR